MSSLRLSVCISDWSNLSNIRASGDDRLHNLNRIRSCHEPDGHLKGQTSEHLMQTIELGKDDITSMLSHNAYASLLKSCSHVKDLTHIRSMHLHLANHGLQCSFIGENMVVALLQCGSIGEAFRIFHCLPCRTAFSWTAIISFYVDCDMCEEALNVFYNMGREGVSPDNYTFVSALKACSRIFDLEEGMALHSEAHRMGLDSDNFFVTSLVNMYGLCGNIMNAERAFLCAQNQDIVLWNSMLSAYVVQSQGEKALQLYCQVWQEHMCPNERTFVITLQACCLLQEEGASFEGKLCKPDDMEFKHLLHIHIVICGLDSDVFVGNSLISMYCQLRRMGEAEQVFLALSNRDIVTWNVLLSGYIENDATEMCLQLYRQMQSEGVGLNIRTLSIVLRACQEIVRSSVLTGSQRNLAKCKILEIGRGLHADSRCKGIALDICAGKELIKMYGSCGSIIEAENAFDDLLVSDSGTWTTLLSVYVEHYKFEKAFLFFEQAHQEAASSDELAYVHALQACSFRIESCETSDEMCEGLAAELGHALHIDAKNFGLDLWPHTGNALIMMYGKCECILQAEHVFTALSHRDGTSWNTMLSVYVELGRWDKALQFFRQMKEEAETPNEWTYTIMLQACCTMAEIDKTKLLACEIGKALHADAREEGLIMDMFVCSSLVHMYGNCERFSKLSSVFISLPNHNLASWNAMLCALVQQGEGYRALQLFEQVQLEGYRPDECTFLAALKACYVFVEMQDVLDGQASKTVALEIGQAVHRDFHSMGFRLSVSFESALLSLHSKCGSMIEIENLFACMPGHDIVSWNTMLSAYVAHDEAEKALLLYRQMEEEHVGLDEWTFSIALQACHMLTEKEVAMCQKGKLTTVMVLEIGQALHACIRRKRYCSNFFVNRSLVNMYNTCGMFINSLNILLGVYNSNDSFPWLEAMSLYVDNGHATLALQLYRNMLQEVVNIDKQLIIIALEAACILAQESVHGVESVTCLEIGQAVWSDAHMEGIELDMFLGKALIDFHSKCGKLSQAEIIFHKIPQLEILPITAMLSAYVLHREGEKALALYESLKAGGVSPTKHSMVSALQACSISCECKEHRFLIKPVLLDSIYILHHDMLILGLDVDVKVCNVLIGTYGRCGAVIEARRLFDGLAHCDTVSWTTMISSYVENVQGENALQLYGQIEHHSMPINDIMLINVLQACCQAGSLDVCQHIHTVFVSCDFDGDLLLMNVLIHAYGHCASMADAQALFDSLPIPDVVSWTALLAGYNQQGCFAMCLDKFEGMCLTNMKPNEVTFLIALSSCNHCGLVDLSANYLEAMTRDYGLQPKKEHYAIILDLLGRAGDFLMLKQVLSSMPMCLNLDTTLCLMRASQNHGNVELGELAFDLAVHLQPHNAAAYVLMANIYATVELPNEQKMQGNIKKGC